MTSETANRSSGQTSISEAGRFISFLMTGGLAAICNMGSRILLSRVMRYELSVAVAYLIGMCVAFVLARTFVFDKSTRAWNRQLTRFATVNFFAFIQVWLVSVGLARLFFPWIVFHWHPETVAHLIGVASPVVLSYYAHKHFSFRSTPVEDLAEELDSQLPVSRR